MSSATGAIGELRGLDIAWAMPKRVTAIDIVARWLKSDVCAVVVEYRDSKGTPLNRYTMRCGSHVWHQFILPALRMWGSANGVICTVREVLPIGPTPEDPLKKG